MRLAQILSVLALLSSAQAQGGPEPGRLTVSPAAIVPLFGMADAYAVGTGVRVGRSFGSEARRVRWAVGLEGAWFDDVPPRFGSPSGAGLSVGATLDARIQVRSGEAPAHASVGIGAFHERAGDHAPYAVVPEVHLRSGIVVPAGRVHFVPEVSLQVVLSDLLSGGEFQPSVRLPVSVGVRF